MLMYVDYSIALKAFTCLWTAESFPLEFAEQPFQRQLIDSSPLRMKTYKALELERTLHGEALELQWLQQLAILTASRRHQ